MTTQPRSNRTSGLFYPMQPQKIRKFSQTFAGYTGDINLMCNSFDMKDIYSE